MDTVILRGNVLFPNEVTVSDQFDVNGNFTVSTAGALSGITTIGSSGLATLGSVSCDGGLITSDGSGSLTASTLTDGTMSITGGEITGLSSVTTTGAIDSGGDLSCGAFVVTQLDGSLAGGATGAEFTVSTDGNVHCAGTANFNGNLSINSTQFLDATTGNLSNVGTVGCGAVTSTGAVQGTSVTDGTFSVSSGAITGATSIACTSINCSGTITGDVGMDQLKTNNAVTIKRDGVTYTSVSNAVTNGTCIILVQCHTDDDANGIWLCTKVTGTAGTCSKLSSQSGTSSSTALEMAWVDTEVPKFKYSSSWGDTTSSSGCYVSILMSAS